MSATNVISRQIKDGTVAKVDLNTTTSGSAVITKLTATNGVAITSSTGVDPGTGDVTIAADLSYLDTKYPSLTASRTQNYVLAAPSSGSGAASFRALVAGDIPTIAISGVTGLQTALDDKISGSGSSGYLPKFTGSKTLGNSLIYDNGTKIGINNPFPSYYYTVDVIGALKATDLFVGDNPYYSFNIGMGDPLDNYAQIGVGADTLRHVVLANYTWSTFVGGLSFAQRMKLNATGLKVGTGDPAYNLDIAGNIGFTGALYVNGSGSMSAGTDGQFLKKTTVSSNPVNIWSNIGISDVTSLQTTLDAKYGGTLTSGYLPVANGTFTLIDSPIYNSGNYTGIGTTSVSGFNLRMLRNYSTTTSYGVSVEGEAQTGVTTVNNFQSLVSTASGVTPTTIRHFFATQGTLTGTPTNQYGFFANNLTGATNNYGFYSNVAAATGAWNFYAIGTANNFFNGRIGIGTTTLTQANINITLPITGNAAGSYGIMSSQSVQSDITGIAVHFRTNATTAGTAWTLSDLIHFAAYRGSIGSTTITRQYGFYVDNTVVGATNNYAFYSNIASGTGQWGFYAGGNANNYMSGNLWIGLTSSSYKLDVNGTARFANTVQFDAIPTCSIAASSANHLVNYATLQAFAVGIKFDPTAVKTVALSNISSLSGHQTISGYTTSGTTDRVLLINQSTPSQNGVYIASSGSWTRDTNFDTDPEIRGFIHSISSGTYAGYKYVNTNQSTITMGTTAITYSEFSNVAETDPVFRASDAYNVTSTLIGQWNSAYTFSTSLTNTNALSEGSSNLYFTTARVLATALTGYSVGTNTALSSSDTVLGAFQKVQGQLNNKLTIGGNTFGAAVAAGTNDAFDFTLKRNGTTQVSLKSTGVEFGADINLLTGNKIKLAGSAGLDHQFIKYNGSNNEWAYMNTGELQDKDDIVMLQNIAGERGFQMYSDSAKTYADAFIFTNTHAGVALGIHGYANDDTDTLKEFGLQLAVDGLLYHKKLDGTRKQIATIDMITGGGSTTWNGGNVGNDINLSSDASIYWGWDRVNTYDARIYGTYDKYANKHGLIATAPDFINLACLNGYIEINSGKYVLPGSAGTVGDTTGIVLDNILFDFQNANNLIGGDAKFAMSSVTVGGRTFTKATLIAG